MTYYHSPRTRELIASLAPVICPSVPSVSDMIGEITSDVQLSMRAFATPPRLALLAGLATYDEGARVFFPSRGRAARQLEGDVARRYFKTWWSSPLALQREFAKGVKALICLAYYEMPAVKAHLGYTPEAWIKKVTKRRLEVYSDAIEAQAKAILAPDPLPPLADEVV